MRKRLVAALAIVAALTVAGIAIAGSLPGAGTGSISLGGVDGSKVGAAGVSPHYQSRVWFDTTGTARLKNPRVWVACYQNGQLVYGEGGSPSETFKLGGDMSQWVVNGGGAANCTAELYYILNAKGTGEWNGNGGQGGTVDLGNTAFSANG